MTCKTNVFCRKLLSCFLNLNLCYKLSSQSARRVSSDWAANSTVIARTTQYAIRYPVPANVVPVGWDHHVTKVITIRVIVSHKL